MRDYPDFIIAIAYVKLAAIETNHTLGVINDEISGAIGRSTSPVAGAAIICASLANVGPMELAKRNIVPMLVGVITFLILF